MAALALLIAAVAAMFSWWLFTAGKSGTPTADAPGTIGIALVGGTPLEGAVQVDGMFDAAHGDSTNFTLAISNLAPTADAEQSVPTVAIYLCGSIGEQVELWDMNGGELKVGPVPINVVVTDTRLGDRSACRYTTAPFRDGFQLLVAGTATRPLAVRSGANVRYSLPGIVTTLFAENVGGKTVEPLPGGSTIKVALQGVPSDFSLTAASPELPGSGQLAWSFPTSSPPEPPISYRVLGSLSNAQQDAQQNVFLAGALVGLAGSALLWSLQALLESFGGANHGKEKPRGARRELSSPIEPTLSPSPVREDADTGDSFLLGVPPPRDFDMGNTGEGSKTLEHDAGAISQNESTAEMAGPSSEVPTQSRSGSKTTRTRPAEYDSPTPPAEHDDGSRPGSESSGNPDQTDSDANGAPKGD